MRLIMAYDKKVRKLVEEFLSDHGHLSTEADVQVISQRVQTFLEEEIEEVIEERQIDDK